MKFSFRHFASKTFFSTKKGITLLLVVLVLSALMSISLSIFNQIFTELRIAGELTSSFSALYIADQGMDFMFYRLKTDPDYAGMPFITPPSGDCLDPLEGGPSFPCGTSDTGYAGHSTGPCVSGWHAYLVTAVYDDTNILTIDSGGQSDCAKGINNVARKFESTNTY